MAVQVYRSTVSDEAQIRFTIDDHIHEGVVSVVGSFNDWTPGVTVFILQPNGTRVADVTVPGDVDIHFRYLGSGGRWFDDPDCDQLTGAGGVIRLASAAAGLPDVGLGQPSKSAFRRSSRPGSATASTSSPA